MAEGLNNLSVAYLAINTHREGDEKSAFRRHDFAVLSSGPRYSLLDVVNYLAVAATVLKYGHYFHHSSVHFVLGQG